MSDYILVITAVTNVCIAFAALCQIYFIQREYEPELIIKKFSSSIFLIRNVGRGIAYNVIFKYDGKKMESAEILKVDEFYRIEIDLSLQNMNDFKSLLIAESKSYHSKKSQIYKWDIENLEQLNGIISGEKEKIKFKL